MKHLRHAHYPIRLERWHRRSLYAVMALLFASGALWLVTHYFFQVHGPYGDGPSPAEPWALRLHGACAMLALLFVGSLMVTHIKRAWILRKNRLSGGSMAVITSVLVVTGYLLYYAGSEQLRPSISMIHWITGLAMAPWLAAHVWLGRAARAAAPVPSLPDAAADPADKLT